jgi:hypothetical protein
MEDLIQTYKYNYIQYAVTSKQSFKDAYEDAEKKMQSFYSEPEPEHKQKLYATTLPPKIQSNNNSWIIVGLGLISFVLVAL